MLKRYFNVHLARKHPFKFCTQAKAAEKRLAENPPIVAVQVDDLLTFRQFSKKSADTAIDVRCCKKRVQIEVHLSNRSMTKTLIEQRATPKFMKTSFPT